MDFKKIKPNDVLGFLDDLVAKIPESISSLLTKVMVGILVLAIIYAMYYGYVRGKGSATQEGQELAKDTKSLFQEDIERDYNRKRKNIRMPSSDSLLSDEIYKTPKQYESYGRTNEPNSIYSPDDTMVENSKSLRAFKRKGETSPLAELNDTAPSQEIPTVTPTRNENTDPTQKTKRKLYLKDSFDNPSSNTESREINSVLDKVNTDMHPEKKILNKKESSKDSQNANDTKNTDESRLLKRNTGKIEVPEKSENQDKKGKLLPINGDR